jgi:hypothetical protein
VTPSTVSSPAFVAVQVTLISADGHRHTARLATPSPKTIVVPAGGRASFRIAGLKAGQYSLYVDGLLRGALAVGGEPGP